MSINTKFIIYLPQIKINLKKKFFMFLPLQVTKIPINIENNIKQFTALIFAPHCKFICCCKRILLNLQSSYTRS